MTEQQEPPGLSVRGTRMWRESLAAGTFAPGHLVLLEEACRISDRLELLDTLIRRDPAESGEDFGGSGGIAALLAESRQQQTALKGILAELRQGQKTGGGSVPSRGTGGKGVADLTARIAARRKQTPG